IGKNIVGVVLACNNFEVIDLGVMVPAATILEEAKKHDVDIIGLSGLITPSLDEMVHIAREMKRLGFTLPIMLGGATTSKAHTAVKIEPEYDEPVVWVKDASRAVGVAQNLISEAKRADFVAGLKDEYARLRALHEGRGRAMDFLSLDDARANRSGIDLAAVPAAPHELGVQVFAHIPLAEIRPYIDWSPFFGAWELNGAYPRILDDPRKGEEARKLYADAQRWLDAIVAGEWLEARAVVGLFPAHATEDDSVVVEDSEGGEEIGRFHFLRQQQDKKDERANLCMADFVAREHDHIGGFAVAIVGAEAKAAEFEKQHDDYTAIMIKVLADRLAEALAEYWHARTRGALGIGGADPDDLDGILRVGYQGCRYSFGYPACPDLEDRAKVVRLLEPERIGVTLSEEFQLAPEQSTDALIAHHPEARYFSA
ncbi:MAG TPA: methionine synthase, partial [Actinobacteria bacterium]|nr:methionine synthase [Actinomycetota bacterium]